MNFALRFLGMVIRLDSRAVSGLTFFVRADDPAGDGRQQQKRH
jgi:hypothetical protein